MCYITDLSFGVDWVSNKLATKVSKSMIFQPSNLCFHAAKIMNYFVICKSVVGMIARMRYLKEERPILPDGSLS